MAIVFTDSGHQAAVIHLAGTASMASGAQGACVGWGTGTGTQITANNALYQEINARVTGTASTYTTTKTNDTFQVVAVMSATAAYGITNAGTFDAGAAGNSYVLGDFSVVNLASGDSISLTVRLQLQ